MWHQKKSRTVLNIFLVILIAVVCVVMYRGYQIILERQKQQDQELAALAVESQQQTQNAKAQSYEELNAAYQEDLDTVEQYMPGIVCWGDVLTEGTASGVSYPSTLQSLINERIVDRYSFKTTIDNYYDYTRIDWDDYKVSIPVVNMGTGSESTYTILGRSGAVPYVTYKDFVIPSDCSQTPIRIVSQADNKSVKPLINGDGGVNPVTIAGIEGTLTADPDSYSSNSDGQYYFSRSTPGAEMEVAAGSLVRTAATDLYRDYIHIVYIGTYGRYDDAQDLADQVSALLSRQQKNQDRFLIVGISSGTSSSSAFYDQFAAIMTQKYGERFLNFRKYLMSEALSDFDIEPTYQDKTNIKYGHMPTSLYVTGSDTEFQGMVYEKLGSLIYDRMESLGYFDEIREELGISKWVADEEN